MAGPPGTKVGIVITHKGSSSREDLILTRKEIKIQGVQSSLARRVGSDARLWTGQEG
jgi:C-terminal processing protease CtpA/Prc